MWEVTTIRRKAKVLCGGFVGVFIWKLESVGLEIRDREAR